MSIEISGTEITILGKTYYLKCSETSINNLHKAAQLLEQHMIDIRKATPTLSNDRLALVAALHISSQFLEQNQLMQERLADLYERLEEHTSAEESY